MHKFKVDRNIIRCMETSPLTSGSVKTEDCYFDFRCWQDYKKTAVFSNGEAIIATPLDDQNHCQIPWEVLTKPIPNLLVGVYGQNDHQRLPTIWCNVAPVLKGAEDGDNESPPPNPELWEQELIQLWKTTARPLTNQELEEMLT